MAKAWQSWRMSGFALVVSDGVSLRSKSSKLSYLLPQDRKHSGIFGPARALQDQNLTLNWADITMFRPLDRAQNLGTGANWIQHPQNGGKPCEHRQFAISWATVAAIWGSVGVVGRWLGWVNAGCPPQKKQKKENCIPTDT